MMGAKEVILTDLEYTLPLMKENIHANEDGIFTTPAGSTSKEETLSGPCCERIECMECDWFSPPPVELFGIRNSAINEKEGSDPPSSHPDIILVADCVWVVRKHADDITKDPLELFSLICILLSCLTVSGRASCPSNANSEKIFSGRGDEGDHHLSKKR